MKTLKFIIFMIILFGKVLCLYAMDYHTGIKAIPEEWNPINHEEGYYYRFANQLFCTLLEIDDKIDISAGLADHWVVKDNGLTYLFHIRKNARFHNGELIKATDVVFSINSILYKGELSDELKIIKSIGVANDVEKYPKKWGDNEHKSIVVIELKKPFQPMLSIFASPLLGIFPEKLIKDNKESFFKSPISCGPFKINLINSKYIQLVKSNYYYGVRTGNIDTLYFYKFNEDEAINQFNDGKLDDIIDYRVDTKKIKRGFNLGRGIVFGTTFIRLNVEKEPFNNVYFRKAFVHAFNKTLFVKKSNIKNIIPANGFIPRGMVGYLDKPEYVEYSIEKSKDFLNRINNKKRDVINIAYNRKIQTDALNIIADELYHSLNIKINLVHLDSKQWYNNWYDMKTEATIGSFLNAYYDSFYFIKTILKYTNINKEEIAKLLKMATKSMDYSQSSSLYRKIDSLIMAKAIIFPIYYGDSSSFVYSENITGLDLPFNGANSVKYKNVVKLR